MISSLMTTENLALFAAIVSLAAFWVSWREIRRNNKPSIRLRHLTASVSGEVVDFKVRIENRGIALQAISMSLNFTGPRKSGNINQSMTLIDQAHCLQGSFLRGTIAEFVLSTTDRENVTCLDMLREPKDQEPAVCLWNNGYLVRTFLIYRRGDFLRRLWNKLSFRMMWRRRVGDGPEGHGVFKDVAMPRFDDRPMQFEVFLDVARRCRAR